MIEIINGIFSNSRETYCPSTLTTAYLTSIHNHDRYLSEKQALFFEMCSLQISKLLDFCPKAYKIPDHLLDS